MSSKTQLGLLDDLIRWIVNPMYNYGKAKLTSATTIPVGGSVLGFPVPATGTTRAIMTAAAVTAAAATDKIALVADQELAEVPVNATASVKVFRLLTRGPAVIHVDSLPTLDPAGAAYDIAKLTTLLSNAGVEVVDETGLTATI